MALMPWEALRRRNVAGPLLLLNLSLYVFMMGFASWALNSFVDGHHRQQQYYPPGTCMCMGTRAGGPRSAGDEATLHFIQFALLASVVGAAAKAATAFHARASWRPQSLAAAAALGTVAWAATALAFGLACKEMRAGGVARGWRMRALEGITTVLALTQLLYVVMLHAAVARDRGEPGCPTEDDDQQPHRGGPCSVM